MDGKHLAKVSKRGITERKRTKIEDKNKEMVKHVHPYFLRSTYS